MTVARLAAMYAPWLAVSLAALALTGRAGAYRSDRARAWAAGLAVVLVAYPVGVLAAPKWPTAMVYLVPAVGAALSLALLAAGLAGLARSRRAADAVQPPDRTRPAPLSGQAADAVQPPPSPGELPAGRTGLGRRTASDKLAAEPPLDRAEPAAGRGGAGLAAASGKTVTAGANPVLLTGGRRRGLPPRGRAAVVRGLQYGVLFGAVLVLALATDWELMSERLFTLAGLRKAGPRIIPDFFNTVRYTLGAFVVSLSLGTVLALMKLSSARLYRGLATAYIEFFRGLPALIVVFAVAYGVPMALGVTIPTISLKAAVALGCVSAAYMAESIRAGIQAVPKGQIEASRSLGMSHGQTLKSVVIPQAFRIVLPPVTNEIILLTKDTSLVYVMGLATREYELTKLARETLSVPEGGLTALFGIGACYLIITLPLGFLVRRMERGFGKAKS